MEFLSGANHAPRLSARKLEGWKAIADYFSRTVRTVQRWERSEGLPVQRHQHHSLSTVFAYERELERWRIERLPFVDRKAADLVVGDTPEILCAMSRELWTQRSKDGLQKSIALAKAALRKHPFPLAYALLAKSYVTRASYGHTPPLEDIRLGEEAAHRALSLDWSSVDAHQALALVSLFKREWQSSRAHFEQALELNTHDPTTYQWFSFLQLAQGRDLLAMEMSNRAAELDPTSLILAAHRAWMLHLTGQYDESIRQSQAVIRRNRQFWRGHFNLALTLAATGRGTEAADAMDIVIALNDQPNLRALRTHALARAGHLAEARAELDVLMDLPEYVSPYWLAFAAAALAADEDVFRQLHAAIHNSEWFVVLLRHDPAFTAIRERPQFNALVRQAGLE